jgi:AcrR family transcriptional regulator
MDAALAVAQARGLSAMSMRAVAEEAGSSVMALYRHVANKDALLDGLVGRVLAEVRSPDMDDPWEDQLRDIARQVFAVAHRYPTVVPLLLTRAYVAPEAVRVVNATSALLRRAGVPEADLPRLERMVSSFLLGFGTAAANGAFWTDPSATRPPMPDASPHATASTWEAELVVDVADLEELIRLRARPGGAVP